jgi:hypothetical protein
MSTDEQMAVLGRMVTERKELKGKEAALADEIARASKELQTVSGLLANYKGLYSHPLKITPAAAELLNADKVIKLVDDLLSTRAELRDLQARLKQAGIE